MALTAAIGSTLTVSYGKIRAYTMSAASNKIWGGATVVVNLAGANEGYAGPAVDDPDDSEKQLVVGWAQETKTGAAGAVVRVRIDGHLKRNAVGADQTWVGKFACVKDDETVQLYGDATTQVVVGRIVKVISTTKVLVNFSDRPMRLATSAED